MKQRPTRTAVKHLTLLAVVAFVCLAQTRAHAQKPSQQQTNPPDAGSRYPNPDMEGRAIELEREKAKSDPGALLGGIQEDRHTLQALNEEMTKASADGQQLDFKYVLGSTAEVKKRALRLKTNLALPQNGKDEKRNDRSEEHTSELQSHSF